jgi:hypothetical protein
VIRNIVMRNENFLPPLASSGRGDRDSFMKVSERVCSAFEESKRG